MVCVGVVANLTEIADVMKVNMGMSKMTQVIYDYRLLKKDSRPTKYLYTLEKASLYPTSYSLPCTLEVTELDLKTFKSRPVIRNEPLKIEVAHTRCPPERFLYVDAETEAEANEIDRKIQELNKQKEDLYRARRSKFKHLTLKMFLELCEKAGNPARERYCGKVIRKEEVK